MLRKVGIGFAYLWAIIMSLALAIFTTVMSYMAGETIWRFLFG